MVLQSLLRPFLSDSLPDDSVEWSGSDASKVQDGSCQSSAPPLAQSPMRWAVLACVATMPCGVHMCYKMTSGIQESLQYHSFGRQISTVEYSLLNSSVSWVNLVVPFFTGTLVDSRPTRMVAISSLLFGLFGQLLFTIGVLVESFESAVAGRLIFGIGEGTVIVAQGAACAQWFQGGELTFAIAITEMTHTIANWLGKIAVNMGFALGNWRSSLWVGVAFCLIGIVFGFMFSFIEKVAERSCTWPTKKPSALELSFESFARLRISFWILLLIHLFAANVEHLFDTISADFIHVKWHAATEKAAWLSSLNYAFAIVLSPLIGWFIDRSSRWRMFVAMLGCCVMGSAHLLLGLTSTTPAVGLSMLSFPEAVMPTILRSSVPLVVRPSAVGLAFGTYEVAESLGKTIGAPLVGYIKDVNGSYAKDELGFAFVSFVAFILCILVSAIDYRRGGMLNGCPLKRKSCNCGPHSCIKIADDVGFKRDETPHIHDTVC